MKLKPRTTYINNLGRKVCIAGFTRRGGYGPEADKPQVCESQPLYWSIQGDHYSEDGRFVTLNRDYEKMLLPADAGTSIKAEVTTKVARDWWKGVKE